MFVIILWWRLWFLTSWYLLCYMYLNITSSCTKAKFQWPCGFSLPVSIPFQAFFFVWLATNNFNSGVFHFSFHFTVRWIEHALSPLPSLALLIDLYGCKSLFKADIRVAYHIVHYMCRFILITYSFNHDTTTPIWFSAGFYFIMHLGMRGQNFDSTVLMMIMTGRQSSWIWRSKHKHKDACERYQYAELLRTLLSELCITCWAPSLFSRETIEQFKVLL